MSASRNEILGRVRAATRSLPHPTYHPDYPSDLSHSGRSPRDGVDLARHFAEQLKGTHAIFAEDWPALAKLLSAETKGLGYCAPDFADALKSAWPEATIETTFDRARVDEYTFGITPAWGAIAETGTLILTDGTTPSRLAALAPWVHVAVVPRERIFATVAEAMTALPDDPSIIFVTGPSKTADIEGILIEGVHGPGRQLALIM